jgi:dipeptidyl aminopeptidase/acylaminoacyl peptidase
MKRWTLMMPLAWLALAGVAGAQVKPAPPDAWLKRPVDDRTFKGYLDFFKYDTRLPFDLQVTRTEEEKGLKREYFSFQSTAGMRVTAVLSQQPGTGSGLRPAIIFLHGGVPAGKEGTLTMASILARAGWSVLSIDLQYFGERKAGFFTTFSEEEKHEKLYNQPSVYLSWITQVVKDVSRSFDVLVAERGIDPRRVALWGGSRGAIAGSIAGAIERRFAAVALIFGAHYDALENNHLPAACPANYIGRIAPRPLLMVNGTQDSDMIREAAVEPLFKLAKQPKQIIWTDGGHMFMTEEHRASIIQWLRDKTR